VVIASSNIDGRMIRKMFTPVTNCWDRILRKRFKEENSYRKKCKYDLVATHFSKISLFI
jgi:hypothetical protein